jgi:hypothetical protein
MNNNIFKTNSILTGLITGLILPVITIVVVYFIRTSQKSFHELLQILLGYNVLTQVISLCVLPNLLLFFIYMWTNKLESARGVIFATFIYTFIVLILKNI